VSVNNQNPTSSAKNTSVATSSEIRIVTWDPLSYFMVGER